MKKYQIIYADPPWRFSQGIQRRSTFKEAHKEEINKHYETMSDKDIIAMNVGYISEEHSILLMWTTDAHLEVAIKALSNWGFKYKTIAFVWNKVKPSIGKYNVKQCEVCLLATKGKAHHLVTSFKERQYIEEKKEKHSKKPIEIKERISRMFSGASKVELFAREKTEGWDVWGNEVESDINLTEEK